MFEMELRSSRRKNDYKKLQITLNDMGVYEEGMELQEMRQIMDALQMSATECETDFLDSDMQLALRESAINFMPTEDGRVFNSTMIGTHDISPNGITPEIIVVQADVHHAMDWSPPKERLFRKRFRSTHMAVDINVNLNSKHDDMNELLEPDIKRFCDVCVAKITIDNDTETNIVEQNGNNSTSNTHNSVNSLQIPTSSLHSIFCEHRINDSGFIISSGTFQSSLSNNATQPSTLSMNNIENFHTADHSVHEIIGPISVRRIHDSGVNTSAVVPQS